MEPQLDAMTEHSPADSDYRERLQRALGRDFELGQSIGSGGFGSVYRARDVRLDRDVAVKALRHDLFPTAAVLERFQREARAVARLRHPNILTIHTVGGDQGIAWMAMPLVEGMSLRTLLDQQGRLSPREAVRIISETARALGAAHDAGFVHRDVKPENIMLDGADRHVLLMDFGIAKALAEGESGLTSAGVVLGSGSYMSPEQARGDTDIDHRSDLYTLGVVAYELLTGSPPFSAKNFHEFLFKQATLDAPDLRGSNGELPDAAAAAIMKCLARDRENRWSRAAELVEELDSVFPRRAAVAGVELKVTGLGTNLALAAFLLSILALGISWLEDVAAVVRRSGPAGEGFHLAISLLTPLRIAAEVVMLASAVAVAAYGTVLHRRFRNWRRVLRHLFPRPGTTIVWIAVGGVSLWFVVMLVFVIPVMQKTVASLNYALPLTLRIVIALSSTIQKSWAFLAVLLVLYELRRRRVLFGKRGNGLKSSTKTPTQG
jgi:hypothetical protein